MFRYRTNKQLYFGSLALTLVLLLSQVSFAAHTHSDGSLNPDIPNPGTPNPECSLCLTYSNLDDISLSSQPPTYVAITSPITNEISVCSFITPVNRTFSIRAPPTPTFL
jgi:hypothetical protein